MMEKIATAFSPLTRMSTTLNARMTNPADSSSTLDPIPFFTVRTSRCQDRNFLTNFT